MRRSHSRARLAVQALEGRVVPAGIITAVFSPTSGLLTITGDDDSNDLRIELTGGVIRLSTPDASTVINNDTDPLTPVDIAGTLKSIKADFKGGADVVSIDPTANFVVSGLVSFKLGDGDNTLDLATTGLLTLGGLTVSGGDGVDALTVRGGLNSTVGGTTKLTYGNGTSTTVLEGVGFTAVTLTAGDASTTPNDVDAINIKVARTFSANMGNSFPSELDFAGSELGGLKATGYSVSSLMTSTVVHGSVTFKTLYNADLQANALTVDRNVTMTAPNPNFEATGLLGTRITGNLSLIGTSWTNTLFQTDVPSEVTGSVSIKGGWHTDIFDANDQFKVGKNLSLTLGGGDNQVNLGIGAAAVTVGGNLSIKGGTGNDLFTLDRVSVTGTATVMTFGGADVLTIETGSTFGKTFTADLGIGDDTISIAQSVGSPAPVTFNGKAKILGGMGNDLLFLGLAPDLVNPPDGGDANSMAVFVTPGSVVDGGLGLNFFDDSTDQASGVLPVNW